MENMKLKLYQKIKYHYLYQGLLIRGECKICGNKRKINLRMQDNIKNPVFFGLYLIN